MDFDADQRVIMHIDMDAFFASIEQRNNPRLLGKPVIVGGGPRGRGVVATCSYEARVYGIHSAMPAAEAYRRCRHGVFIHGDYASYDHASRQVKAIFGRFTPQVEMISIDEAFLDLSGTAKLMGTPLETARKIKRAILKEVGITCSVGVGPNKLIAKLASGLEKPNGLTIITPDEIEKRLYPLPVDELWGVGPVTYKKLRKYGIETIGDLARCDSLTLQSISGSFGHWLGQRAKGIDDQPVLDDLSQPDEKSISHGLTLENDTADFVRINSLLLALGERVVIRMQRGAWLARTATLILRFADFQTITRQQTLLRPTDDLHQIYETVSELVPTEAVTRKKVRLVGVRVSNLIRDKNHHQIDLFSDNPITKRKQLELSIKQLRDRFGESIITNAGATLCTTE